MIIFSCHYYAIIDVDYFSLLMMPCAGAFADIITIFDAAFLRCFHYYERCCADAKMLILIH